MFGDARVSIAFVRADYDDPWTLACAVAAAFAPRTSHGVLGAALSPRGQGGGGGVTMTNALTGLTTICYAAQLFAQQRGWSLVDCGALKPSLIVRRGEWWRLITPMLLHSPPDEGFCGLPVHLVLNMWSLQNIGSVLEQIYGPWRMLNAYVLSGVGGSAFYSIVAGDESEAVGASAGICGLCRRVGRYAVSASKSGGIRIICTEPLE